MNRREAFEKVTKVATIPIALNPLLVAPSGPAVANDALKKSEDASLKNSYSVYKVNPDASEALAPTIEAVDVSDSK